MALSKTVHPHDRTRFTRLTLVILEELTPLLQDILQNEISPNQLLNEVSRQKSLFQKLRAEQTVLIQNAQTDGYKDFDITLLYTLLRNLKCLKITAPTQGWGTSQRPGNGETTPGDDIERIRLIRNKIYGHVAVPALSETEFQEHWSNISDICKRMQTLLGKNYVQSLQMAEVRAIDLEMENTYLEKIKSLCTAEKSMKELLQEVIKDRAPCVEENVRVEARDPQLNKLVETLTNTSISILNDMKDSITEMTPDSDIELLFESIEEFISENKENISTLTSFPFFEELEQKIKRYAYLKKSPMQTLARHLRFILRLKKMYGAELECSQGSLLLKLTFSSEGGCDHYMHDLERGEIGELILSVLLYPPYLANFNLHAEDLMIYLNDNEITAETMWVGVTQTPELGPLRRRHMLLDILEKGSSKIESLQKDLDELETRIYPRYEEMASDVQTEKAELELNYGKLTTAADQQGHILHREITSIVNQRKSDIQEMKNKHLSTLNKNTEEITQKMTELKQIMSDLKSILKSNDVSLTSTYKSRNSEFRTLPPKVRVTVPSLSAQKINKDQLNEMFGSLSPLSINTEDGDTMKSAEAVSSPPVKPLLHEPRITATINTGYKYLISVSCLSEKVWTSGYSKIMKLLNLQGKLLTPIQTESGNQPWDIAVTREGDLVFADYKSINLVKNKLTQTVITLQGWKPLSVCSTSSDDLLVTMTNDNRKQSKVVRYSGSTEKQTIQFDDQGRPLYSSDGNTKYINENRNLDICVADWTAKAVVVVDKSGKLRFRYTGYPSNTKESFDPRGITTDSQSHILTADWYNDRIHILDQDGQFLRYIHCDLERPLGLCVDIRDNLFVAELNTAKVKKIQYLETRC